MKKSKKEIEFEETPVELKTSELFEDAEVENVQDEND